MTLHSPSRTSATSSPPLPARARPLTARFGFPPMSFFAPPTHQTRGVHFPAAPAPRTQARTLTPRYLPRLVAGLPRPLLSAYAVSHDLDGFLLPEPCSIFHLLTPMGFVLPAFPHQPPPPHCQTKNSLESSTQNSRPEVHAQGLTPTNTDPKTQAPTFTLQLAPSPPVRIHRPRSSPKRRPSPSLLTSYPIRRQRTQQENHVHDTASILSTEGGYPSKKLPAAQI
jgi:hypothetical protein